MQILQIQYKILNEAAIKPTYANAGDGGLDFYAIDPGYVVEDRNGRTITYKTGIAIEIPEGFVGLVFPRSSIATKTSLILSNAVGVIDSGYRGEIIFKFRDTTPGFGKLYKAGDKIGQLIIMPYPKIELNLVDSLSDSERGIGAYGSSGD